MGRRAKPPKKNAEAKRPLASKSPKDGGAKVRDLEKRLAEALKLQAEALDQQTATAEILRVISSSPTDVQPVFDAIVQGAVRLCEGLFGTVLRLDGDRLHLAAHHNLSPAGLQAYREHYPVVVNLRETVASGAVLDRRVVQVIDSNDPAVPLRSVAMARATGFRGVVVVPMLRGGEPIGVINVARQERGPFPDRQVALLQTFADQAVIAIENVRLFKELEARNRDLTATSEILRVISRSPTDVQPVFDAVAVSAAALCGAVDALIMLVDGSTMRRVAHFGAISSMSDGRPVTSATPTGRAIVERRVIHNHDILEEFARGDYLEARRLQEATGFRTVLTVPLIREENVIGAITIRRLEVRPFTEEQIALVKTFADQAVIAIENVRLFNKTKEALEQQTATSEILRVIASSPTDAQPVFDTIVRRSDRLLGGLAGSLALRVRDEVHLVAFTPTNPEGDAFLRRLYPVPIGQDGTHAEVVRLCRPRMIADTEAELTGRTREFARIRGFRSRLSVPLIRDGIAIGSLGVTRPTPGVFTDREIALLQTFADQAVIAIENVRLFTELQASNRELTTALDTQTATSDILRVISRSQTDVQPVFDAIMSSATRLLKGHSGALMQIVGDHIELAALTATDAAGEAALRVNYSMAFDSGTSHALTIQARAPFNVADCETDSRLTEAGRRTARARGYRSQAVVPLLRHGAPIGTISVTRREPGGFTDDEIALLQTFADQAVIAIENGRLFTELQARTQELTRSVGELQALGEVGQAISSTLDLQTVLRTIVARATQLADADAGVIYEYDEQREVFEPRATERLEDDIVQTLVATPVRKGQGATGRLAEVREPIQLADVRAPGEQLPVRDALIRAGYRALLAVPLVREDHLIGGLTVFRKTPGAFAAEIVDLLKTFATQSSLAIQNARLFREIGQKSRELEVASQHKSEFLANMSHELRTPLNAIIGFSEVLTERMFGELNEKQDEYLRDIYASGQHLLSLINDILDLSKIEAGRMELELTDFDLPTALENALTLVRERAGRRGIALGQTVDERLGQIRGDERKVKQVLLNLLSNALKFTPEGGRVEVSAGVVDAMAEISVTDTGVGIAPEDQEAIFEEFRQVGTAAKKVEGTGLGLALSRKFVELHGGRIWVQSQVGEGSTFTFTLPVRREEMGA